LTFYFITGLEGLWGSQMHCSGNQIMVILHLEFFVVYTIKSFALEGEKCNILRDIYCGNQSGRQEEIVAKVARELQHSSEWSETNSLLLF